MLLFTISAHAQPRFPMLTGQVVDDAKLLSAATRTQLTRLLAAHEQETSNQIVVVTLNDLNGYEISDYAYQLGRHWQIGQAGKDNGVLLIVAKQERKIRIEVGYGLEGALTDALSSQIIRNEISPLFKQGDFDAGINAGTQAIVQAIRGEYTPEPKSNNQEPTINKVMPFMMFGAIGGQMILAPLLGVRRKKPSLQAKAFTSGGVGITTGLIGGFVLSSLQMGLIAGIGAAVLAFFFFGGGGSSRGGRHHGGWGGSSGGFGGGGGFSGGGGSFGGGGASGGW